MWSILGTLMVVIFICWTIMVTYNLLILDKKINDEVLKTQRSKSQPTEDHKEEF